MHRFHYTRKAIQDAVCPAGKSVHKMPKESGLYIAVFPNGTKAWRHSVVVNGRETSFSYGNFPEVKIKEARDRRDDTRKQIRDGIDPAAVKRAEREGNRDSFRAIASEWLAAGCPPNKKGKRPDPDTIAGLRRRLEKYVYPRHGNKPIREIGVTDLHATLKRITSKGKIETAHRVRSIVSRVFKYAVASGRADRDPAGDLSAALPSVETQSFAAITEPDQIGALLRAIDGFEGQPATMAALKLAPYVFVPPGELRGAEWSEIDLDAAEWRIPAARMKMSKHHLVPLSKQAVAILRELYPITGGGRLVFPGIRSANRPISENTINGALRRLGYTSEQMTGHGFRSTASTRLNELGFDPDLIEVQSAHLDKDRVRAIYNRINTESYKADRRKLMQAYADYLDGLRDGTTSNVVPLRRA